MAEYVHLTLRFHLEGTEWVGVCLGTSTFAPTLAECQDELEELVTDHITVLEDVFQPFACPASLPEQQRVGMA